MESRYTVFITGGTRGVGLEIAKRFAQEGANVAIVGKTVEPNPKLPGTLATAEAEIRAAGANDVLAIACDIRDVDALKAAIDQTGEKFGKIDLLVNNASVLNLTPSDQLEPKRFNLMFEVIVRGSFYASQFALPYLKKSTQAKIINIAPSILIKSKWFGKHSAYTVFKYSSAMLVVGLANELAEHKIAVNGVWPKTLLATAAVQNLLGGAASMKQTRQPRVVADAIYYLSTKPTEYTGNLVLDEEVLNEFNVDLEQYATVPGQKLLVDFYVE